MAPLDEAWGVGAGTLTPALARVAARAGLERAFAQGADLVAEAAGVRVEPEVVRAMSESMGHLVEADQQEATAWAVPSAAVPATLIMAVDGVMVQERTRWREVKVGRLAPLGPRLVRAVDPADVHLAWGPSTYCAGLEEADHFWPRVMREAQRAGWSRGVRTVVLIGDGADWIWRQGRTQLGIAGVDVVEIVDFFPASEHLGTVAAAVFGPGSPAAAAWRERQAHRLRHEGVRLVRRALASLRPRGAKAVDIVRQARAYFRTHAARMTYPAFPARGFPIGSGAIESTAKNLIPLRHVQAGMRWSLPGAQALASLRALHRSGRWEAFWQTQPLRRLRQAQPRHRHPPPLAALPLAMPATPPSSPVPVTALVPTPATRIQTADKPWAKGKDYWRRGLPRTA